MKTRWRVEALRGFAGCGSPFAMAGDSRRSPGKRSSRGKAGPPLGGTARQPPTLLLLHRRSDDQIRRRAVQHFKVDVTGALVLRDEGRIGVPPSGDALRAGD